MSHADVPSYVENEAAWLDGRQRNIIRNAQKTFAKNFPEEAAYIENCVMTHHDEHGNGLYKNEFLRSLCQAWEKWGKLTDNQLVALRKMRDKERVQRAAWAAKREEEAAASKYIGEVGKRLTAELTCLHIIELESFYGTSWMYICKDADGNSVLYRGTGNFLDKGETNVKVTFTVKAHELYKGARQTIISRPKVLEAKQA